MKSETIPSTLRQALIIMALTLTFSTNAVGLPVDDMSAQTDLERALSGEIVESSEKILFTQPLADLGKIDELYQISPKLEPDIIIISDKKPSYCRMVGNYDFLPLIIDLVDTNSSDMVNEIIHNCGIEVFMQN